jgi:hypothetical protein
LAKNSRPISLLECLGKLLEKVVAKLIYRDIKKHALIPTTQFGGRNASSSTLDGGLTLLHDIQSAHQVGLRAGIPTLRHTRISSTTSITIWQLGTRTRPSQVEAGVHRHLLTRIPVLTYGCQLWFTGKQVSLVKKLQTVQNDAVKIISGSFRTAPRKALHHLLTILPMDLRLRMLVQNTALRLYKIPKDSQVLKKPGGAWHTPLPDDLPLPVATRRKTKTTLRSLAARVSDKGPRVDPFHDIPADAPHWNGRVHIVSKQKDWNYDQINSDITTACQQGRAINVSTSTSTASSQTEDEQMASS